MSTEESTPQRNNAPGIKTKPIKDSVKLVKVYRESQPYKAVMGGDGKLAFIGIPEIVGIGSIIPVEYTVDVQTGAVSGSYKVKTLIKRKSTELIVRDINSSRLYESLKDAWHLLSKWKKRKKIVQISPEVREDMTNVVIDNPKYEITKID